MRLVATTSASKPSIVINASPRAISARITPRMVSPPSRSPTELFNSVHLWRRNGDGNEGMHRQIGDEARRPANGRDMRAVPIEERKATLAKLLRQPPCGIGASMPCLICNRPSEGEHRPASRCEPTRTRKPVH
jgi:hypothetical protein